jgi:hypothetical protein
MVSTIDGVAGKARPYAQFPIEYLCTNPNYGCIILLH